MAESSNGSAIAGALLGLYALTSLHPGSGTALGTGRPARAARAAHPVADHPRLGVSRACSATPAGRSTLALADEDPTARPRDKQNASCSCAAFGPATDSASEFAGSVSFTDARLLAFPVRSLAGVFAHVTCPAVLRRLVATWRWRPGVSDGPDPRCQGEPGRRPRAELPLPHWRQHRRPRGVPLQQGRRVVRGPSPNGSLRTSCRIRTSPRGHPRPLPLEPPGPQRRPVHPLRAIRHRDHGPRPARLRHQDRR